VLFRRVGLVGRFGHKAGDETPFSFPDIRNF
jgi:hypothetical protein